MPSSPPVPSPTTLYEHARSEWRALTGAALVGLGLGALGITREYVTERHQFGRAIGSFQAIQHTLADVAVALDGAQLLARKAAWAFDTDREDTDDLAAMALLFAAEHAQHAAERGLHFHGGYGFMQEYDIQLYYRRAKGWPLVIDSPRHEYRRLAARRYGPLVEHALMDFRPSAAAEAFRAEVRAPHRIRVHRRGARAGPRDRHDPQLAPAPRHRRAGLDRAGAPRGARRWRA